ncbi:MAG: adenylate/guanylate cyclase domain-containing protein [Vulcanimicrobiaceae bacterium]
MEPDFNHSTQSTSGDNSIMSWNEQKSRERVQHHVANIGEIDVSPLKREVTNLEALLSETSCREIFGAHVYCDVTDFDELASDPKMKREAYQSLIQTTHIYQREVTRIAQDIVGDYRVHFQGAKVHVLCYLPIGSETEIATKAAFLLLVLNDFSRSVFNKEFTAYPDWSIGGGADIGNAIGTRNGKNGKRELLFIGNPANHAAKIITDKSSLRITKRLHDSLPEDLEECCAPLQGDNYKISASQETLDALCAKHGVEWDRAASATRIADDRMRFPLADIDYSEADVAIVFETLGWKNSKRVLAASVFADVSGFTKFVEDAVDDEGKEQALKVFHVIRKEFMKVATDDHAGVIVQFQGDRIQALFHIPKGDAGEIASAAVEAAIGMQSSFEQVIKDELPEAAPLTIKIGIDMGMTLASRLGAYGDRDNICLGMPVQEAANIEERCGNCVIGISKTVFGALEDNNLQKHFKYEKAYDCWVGRGLTWEKIDATEDAAKYDLGKALTIVAAGAAAAAGIAYAVSKSKGDEERQVQPSRTYAP